MQAYGQTRAAESDERARSGDLPNGPSDAALIDRMRGGDDSALAALYDRWSQRVYSLAAHLLRDKRDAEDIVEETFWQAWRGAAQFDADRGSAGTGARPFARTASQA
jgi:RNA polymerase sigma-70 factor (ECF subfamily)